MSKAKGFDLEERTAKFGEDSIDFAHALPKNEITRPLINQFIKCSTSIGANYCEADNAETKKDFKHKIGICRKESKETKHFLRMIARAVPAKADKARILWHEARELNLIFNAIFNKT